MRKVKAGDRESLRWVWRRMTFGLLLCASCIALRGAPAGSLEEKLEAATVYVPQATSPVDQLVEVAQRFKIPMAIEWLESENITRGKAQAVRSRRIRELIEEIASASPQHRVDVEDGLVRVYSPVAALHPFNFLNIRLQSYCVNDGDLFAADEQLRWAIRFTLEPEKYMNGYGGGYGHGANDVFQIQKFTLSASDLTIREVLDRIALAQGNALWVATIKSVDLAGAQPYWEEKGAEDEHASVTSGWCFLPLANITELANENVTVDLTIDGLLDRRMTTIPVVLESGLTGNSGGTAGGASSEGTSYDYSASVEKVGKNFLTLMVHLTVRRRGEAELKFDKKLKVTRSRVTELQPDPRIRIRGYFEPRGEALDDRR